jgi:hypothetical protein
MMHQPVKHMADFSAYYIMVANLSSTRDRMNALSLQSPHDVASLIGADWTIS